VKMPPAVRIAAGSTAVVALASAVMSWDALSWGASQLGVDQHLDWLFPVAVDGTIATGTAAALALRGAPRRVRLYVWTVLGTAIAVSVVGNAAHAAGGNPLHQVGSAVPAVALAASLHLLIVLVRHVKPGQDGHETAKTAATDGPPQAAKMAAPSRPLTARDAAIRVAKRAQVDGREVTTDDIHRVTGRSKRQSRRLKDEALSAVSGQSTAPPGNGVVHGGAGGGRHLLKQMEEV
jgi:hypothetical protein